jgi:hypothetical protein
MAQGPDEMWIWDLTPDDGGPPVYVRMTPPDAKGRLARDSQRYRLQLPEEGIHA